MVGKMPMTASLRPSSAAPTRQASHVVANSSCRRVKTRPAMAQGLPFNSTLKAASSGTTSGLSKASRKRSFWGAGLPSASTSQASSSKPAMSPRWLKPPVSNNAWTASVSSSSRRRNRV